MDTADDQMGAPNPDAPAGDGSATVFAVLRREHARLIRLLDQYEMSVRRPTRSSLLARLCHEVRLHCTAEAGVFTPAFAAASGESGILDHVGAEYAAIVSTVNELCRADLRPLDEEHRVRDLRRQLLNHIRTAEAPDGVFTRAASYPAGWDDVARQLVLRRRELAEIAARHAKNLAANPGDAPPEVDPPLSSRGNMPH